MANQLIVVDRPPRIQPDLPLGTFKIAQPPERDSQAMRRLLQLALPLVTVIGFGAVSMTSSGNRGPITAIVMSLSVLGASALSLFSYLQDKKKQAEVEKAYAARIVTLNKE